MRAGNPASVTAAAERRRAGLHARRLVALRLLGDRLFTPEPLPLRVAGISTRLLLAWLANYDAWEWLQLQLCAVSFPAVFFVERSLSTDTVELGFSLVATYCGYKPALLDFLGVAKRVQWVEQLRATPPDMLGFFHTVATSSRFGYALRSEESRSKVAQWNDSSALADGAEVLRRKWQRWVAAAKKQSQRYRAVRDYHKARGGAGN